MSAEAVIISGLEKSYPGSEQPAVKGIDLTISQGEFFGLLGPNGAGKSTTIAMLSGLMDPDSGTIEILEQAMGRNRKKVKALFGLVPQEIALYETLSGRENLRFFGRLYNIKNDLLKDRIEFCLDFSGLNKRADKQASTYSGGMKRRLNLAIALLHEPRILFLDEPTVGIDAQSRQLIHSRLQELVDGGVTIIYTTHYMEEAEHLCSRVAIIDQGRILDSGSPGSLNENHQSSNLEETFFQLTGKGLRD
ncbi:MAG: ABC transporter ATP-binding protein [Thermodesulfobacteriota bacterium]